CPPARLCAAADGGGGAGGQPRDFLLDVSAPAARGERHGDCRGGAAWPRGRERCRSAARYGAGARALWISVSAGVARAVDRGRACARGSALALAGGDGSV